MDTIKSHDKKVFKLTESELQSAYDAIVFHGYSTMLPPAYEWKSIESNWPLIKQELENIDLDLYIPSKPLRIFAPKSRANIRVVHLLHPVDLIIYTALVLLIKDDIEAARISRQARRVYSYRVDRRKANRLYDSRGAYDKYLDQLGPVNTNWPDYVTFQVWNLPKLNTNALRRICHYSAETSGFLTAKCSTPSCMSPNRDASGAGCRPGLETGTPSTPE